MCVQTAAASSTGKKKKKKAKLFDMEKERSPRAKHWGTAWIEVDWTQGENYPVGIWLAYSKQIMRL